MVILLNTIFPLLMIAATAFILTGLKIAIFRMFNFICDRAVWKEYLIYHVIVIIGAIIIPISIFGIDAELTFLILNVILPILTVFIFIEYFYFYKKHFSYESRNRYILSLIVSYLINFMVLNVLLYVYLALLLLLLSLITIL
ncbi:hypothetical protein [Mariniplasma anaerobium]|uniref:Uncharacterized protein n=1 Tax=Mariniplasma anaerobium TaxID=2735436 RepID=A0A7U9XWP6_9MOLU|nr:hypothetical protein [Mariniplasma anaerobium]BCR36639.1 hypothetical protein MPAN_015320 [Mariniplasma anaerobium]